MTNDRSALLYTGQFSALRVRGLGKEADAEVEKSLEHVEVAEAGSLVLWDWRVPHSSSQHHTGTYSLPG